jgi:hypothetical protein
MPQATATPGSNDRLALAMESQSASLVDLDIDSLVMFGTDHQDA